jgi:RNA polymerase sigma-70 factor (ECF subfamily)
VDPLAEFGAVFECYHPPIWRFLARSAGRQVADELAGEVFLIAPRRRSSYDPERGSVPSWLYGIAANLLRDRTRRAARGRRAVLRLAGRREADGVTLPAEHDESDAVLACLRSLGDQDREVLVLFAWERLSYEEIAAALAVPIGTVRSRLARARARLRDAMELAGLIDGLPVEAADAPTHGGKS